MILILMNTSFNYVNNVIIKILFISKGFMMHPERMIHRDPKSVRIIQSQTSC